MANMSYCQFRNTLQDFSQCLEAVGNAETINDFSPEEQSAATELKELAEQYINWFNQLEEDSLDCEEEYE